MEYAYGSAAPDHTNAYLWPAVIRALPDKGRICELGCGNGFTAQALGNLGYDVVAIDSSVSGIAVASGRNANCKFEVASVYDDLASRFGSFDAVVSLEVVEHLMSPARFAETTASLLRAGGIAVISTPYHGYLKNLALSLLDRWDSHHTALWEGGHVKFWSRSTLRQLFETSGLRETRYERVGRIPPLAKSMVCTFERPQAHRATDPLRERLPGDQLHEESLAI